MKQACDVGYALVGVGTPRADATMVHMGYQNAQEARGLRDRGVVGDILGQFFDADGNVVDLPIHDRRIGIELSDLAHIPKVVGVAGGLHKTAAILGAPHGGSSMFWSPTSWPRSGCSSWSAAGQGGRNGPDRPGRWLLRHRYAWSTLS